MLKILQARLQQYVNHEITDVQGGFRKGRETRDQITNICWIIEKPRECFACFLIGVFLVSGLTFRSLIVWTLWEKARVK